ncbi:hypothetical protein BD410DRAFT_787761 [Rickenella mellea]|uniref:Uncharacterized protein n=1 Tax=Rickenella mellea TaxID=50990 RepID=A0A4Y7Q730_9AGAM|nr:hypothetical protein BD410DRAFT_787761 [Rickenella mellea]
MAFYLLPSLDFPTPSWDIFPTADDLTFPVMGSAGGAKNNATGDGLGLFGVDIFHMNKNVYTLSSSFMGAFDADDFKIWKRSVSMDEAVAESNASTLPLSQRAIGSPPSTRRNALDLPLVENRAMPVDASNKLTRLSLDIYKDNDVDSIFEDIKTAVSELGLADDNSSINVDEEKPTVMIRGETMDSNEDLKEATDRGSRCTTPDLVHSPASSICSSESIPSLRSVSPFECPQDILFGNSLWKAEPIETKLSGAFDGAGMEQVENESARSPRILRWRA